MEQIEQEIMKGLRENLDLEDAALDGFGYDTPLFATDDAENSLGLDSIDALELMVMIQEKWGFEVPSEDAVQLQTVHTIADYVRSRLEEK